jgi:hypothetical protein
MLARPLQAVAEGGAEIAADSGLRGFDALKKQKSRLICVICCNV